MTVLLATLAAAVPVHHQDCQSLACVERVAAKRCTQAHPVSCIHRAAIRWQVSYRMLRRKATCESRLDPLASNGTHFGLFQFAPSTFSSTPYRQHSLWRAKWNALAAGWMHAHGRGNEWACR